MTTGAKGRSVSDWREILRDILALFARVPTVSDEEPAIGTWSSRRINRLATALQEVESYLEVGVASGATLEAVALSSRTAVDPRPTFSLQRLPRGVSVFQGTSDDYFGDLDSTTAFDLIFLDGLHTYQQTYRDLISSLHHSRPRSVVLIDDVVPSDEVSAMPDMHDSWAERARRSLPGKPWHGDVFRLIPLLRAHHPELGIRTIVGSGNEQALAWKATPAAQIKAIDSTSVDAFGRITYSDVFSRGIPESFGPGEEDEVIDSVVRALNALTQSG